MMNMSSYVPALDCWIMLRDLPSDAKGFITRDGNNTNYIIINKNLSENGKLNTLVHEIVHLVRCDLDSDEDREEIEKDIIVEK
jgi:Zn-dependent peptidase ImmA (M78 family)